MNWKLSLLSLCLSNGIAQAIPLLIAPETPDLSGGSFLAPYSAGTVTYDQLILSSAFSALTGPALLTGINLNTSLNSPGFMGQLVGATIRVGVTSVNRTTISSTLSNNATGPLSLVASNYTPVFQAGPFNHAIVFDTPFLYNPASGNLLIEIFQPSAVGVSLQLSAASQTARAVNSSLFGNSTSSHCR